MAIYSHYNIKKYNLQVRAQKWGRVCVFSDRKDLKMGKWLAKGSALW
jgi:hypothetical protein